MRTDASAQPARQGLLPAQPGAQAPGKAGGAGSARAMQQPSDLVLRKSGVEGTPRPRTQVPLPTLSPGGLDLAAQRQRVEVARLAGEAARLAGQKQELERQVDEQARLLHDAQARLSLAEQHAQEPEVPPGSALSDHLAAARRAQAAAAAVPELQRQVFPIEWRHQALAQELQSSTARLQEAEQRLATAERGMARTPDTPATPATPAGSPTSGIPPEDLRKALQTALEAGTVPPREQVPTARATQTGNTPAALSALELADLHSALRHEGAAVTRLARRARLQEPHSQFDRFRAPLQRAPRPLEGQLLESFRGKVRDDIATIASQSGRPPLQAAELMQRAVQTGVLGASLPAQARQQLSRALDDVRAHLAASTPAAPPPRPTAINSLNSGVKVDLSHQPEATLANLPPQELDALFKALKLGQPQSGARELHQQKRQAQDLLDGFCHKLPDLMTRTSRVFHGPSAAVKLLMRPLPEQARRRLEEMARISHCKVLASEIAAPVGTGAPPRVRLDIYFGAAENWRDIKQVFKTVAGGHGAVYKAADEVAALLADGIRAMDGPVEIGFVSGASLGGGTAQAFLAGLESRVRLPESPPLILLDPPLLNNTQSLHATRHGEIGYDFEKPRGIAISLDYDKDPRRGLMGMMKGPGGYKYPGLLHLRLGLTDTDGPAGSRPVASPLGLGYHHHANEFITAIHRFTSDPQESWPPTASMRSDRSGPRGT